MEPTTEPMQPQVPVVPVVESGPIATTTSVLVADKVVSYGETTSLAAAVPVGASGTITFKDGSKVIATGVVQSGLFSVVTPATLKVGKHRITAVYSGDAANAPSTSVVSTLTVKKAKTKVAVTKTKSVKGGKTVVKVKASSRADEAAATGKIRVYVGKKVVKTVTLRAKNNGTISVTLPKKYSSKMSVKVKYMGSSKLAAKTSKTIKVVPRKG